MMEYQNLTERIIGAAIEVHRLLGPGFVESIYENALTLELHKRGLRHSTQHEVPIFYEGVEVGKHRLDLLVEDRIVVELKSVKTFNPIHFAIVKSYLKATGLNHGLLLNFAAPKLEMKRVISS